MYKRQAYGRKGEKVVQMNNDAVDAGMKSIVKVEVPAEWANAADECVCHGDEPAFIKNIMRPMEAQKGDKMCIRDRSESTGWRTLWSM